MGKTAQPNMSFFRRLATDATANTLAISAASLVPVVAMVGGGVDASRYYMADSRMQAACDAGALAARRAMSRNNFDDATHGDTGRKFFANNFADGQFGVENLTYNYRGTVDGEVEGEADAKMPSTIMALFGFDEFDLSVTCQADINISDTDIMMVLDITGSMGNAANGSCPGGRDSNNECNNSRIANLRTAVESFYTTVDTNTSANAQVRYGFVPYAGHVNVSDFMQAQWMADTFEYSSRRGRIGDDVTRELVTNIDAVRMGGVDDDDFTRIGGSERVRSTQPSLAACQAVFDNPPESDPFNNNRYFSHDVDDLTEVSQTETPTADGFTRVTEYTGPVTFLHLTKWFGNYNSGPNGCDLRFLRDIFEAEATLTITEEVTLFEWEYGRFEWDVSNAFAGTVSTPTGWNYENEDHTWNGCVLHNTLDNETDPGNFDPVPSDAHDINIDLVPTSDDEKWGPELPSLVRLRYPNGLYHDSNGDYVGFSNGFNNFVRTWQSANIASIEDKPTTSSECPTVSAQKLATIDNLSEITGYLAPSNGFKPGGTTIHNVGLLWGARLMSPDGLFASENAVAPGGNAISRHLVFMTDGEMTAQVNAHTAYGIHQIDYKVRPDSDTAIDDDRISATAVARHNARLQAICTAVRNKDITLWVIAFGTTLTQELTDCATPGRAFQADNATQLNERFAEIAQTIAALRLTQ